MKFVPKDQEEPKTEVELFKEGTTLKSRIRYPEPKRTAQEYDEYDEYEDEDDCEDL